MKISLIDIYFTCQQAIRPALQPTRFEYVPLFLSRQVFEAINLYGTNLLMVGAYAHGMPGLSLVRNVRKCVGPGMAIVYLVDDQAGTKTAETLDHGVDLCFQGDICAPKLLMRFDALTCRFAMNRAVWALGVRLGPYTLDWQNHSTRLRDTSVSMHVREFESVPLLLADTGRALPCAGIEPTLWGRELSPYLRTLDTHILCLRRKLLLDTENGLRLCAIYGQDSYPEHVIGAETTH